MKITTFFVLSLLLVASLPCFGLNYTITFTGTGASSTVNSVIVQNLTKGTTVTVPAGNVLNLSDAPNAVGQVSANKPEIGYIGTDKPVSSGPQKTKSSILGTTTMAYTAGDQLLYTATSGTYIASEPDVPTDSKTINFIFTTLPTSAIPAGTFTMGSPLTEVNR